MVYLARGAHQQGNFVNHLLFVPEHLFVGESVHLLDGSRDGVGDSRTLEMDGVEDVAYDFFGNVVVTVNLLDNHPAFLFHLAFVHAGVHEHVSDNIDGKRQMAPLDLCIKAGLLPGGIGFQVPALVFNGPGDLKGAAVLGTLEYQVLVKVAQAVFVLCLVTAASWDPDANGHGIGVGHVVGENSDAVFKFGLFDKLFH